MATLYTQAASNVRKTWGLMLVFFVLIAALGWFLSVYYGSTDILVIAIVFSLFMNVAGYWFSDKVALAMSGAKPAPDAEFPDLHNIVENLAITAGLPKPRVYIINDAAPNAFATGRNKDHAAVAVTTGLLAGLNRAELEGVLAHELAHIGNRDILVATVAVILAGFVAILSDIFLRGHLFGGRNRNNNSRGGGALAIIGLVLIVLAPIFATLIRLAISRRREYLADASGALLTRYPEGLASALEKIGAHPAPLARASDATAHLFISNPFGARAARGLHHLFLTHPPLVERIKLLREMR